MTMTEVESTSQEASERLLAQLEAESVVPLRIMEAEIRDGRTPFNSRRAEREALMVSRCPKGHLMEGWNVYFRRNGRRECRTCRNDRDRSLDAWL